MHPFLTAFICVSSLLVSLPVAAKDDVYQKPEAFITETFEGAPPSASTLKANAEITARVKKIMGPHYRLNQTRYWRKNGRTAWILEEIGKHKPITTGLVVANDGTLERVKVLVYRESYGWEVKHTFFTRQFKGAGLKRGKKLDTYIDGIAGATLSVNALTRLSALALMLHEEVTRS